jgi:hypothetical protein
VRSGLKARKLPEEFPVDISRDARGREQLVQLYRLLQRRKIGAALRATIEVFPDGPALRGIRILIQILADELVGAFAAGGVPHGCVLM